MKPGNKYTIALAGGGTGGHIYPALAVAEQLRRNFDETSMNFIYLGKAGGLEERLAKEADIPFIGLKCGPFNRRRPLSLFYSLPLQLLGFIKASGALKDNNADAVLVTGGYAGLPGGLASAWLKIPMVLHEQNAVAGLTNRILAKFASIIASGMPFKGLLAGRKVKFTGNPVRPSLINRDRAKARASLNLKDDDFFILATGGSGGAETINKAVTGMKDMISDDIRILLAAGKGRMADLEVPSTDDGNWDSRIKVVEYICDIGDALTAADLVICRAGAITLAEITLLGKPAVVIPYPYAAEDHQKANAIMLEENGAAVMIDDADLNCELLISKIEVIRNEKQLDSMRAAALKLGKPDAASHLGSLLLNCAGVMENTDG